MRRAFLLAGGLLLLGLGVGCSHYHGVCDCQPITNSAVCGFYANALRCATPAPPLAGAPAMAPVAVSPSAFEPLQVMPKAEETLPPPR